MAPVLIWTNYFFCGRVAPGAPAEPVAPNDGKQKTRTQWGGVKNLVRQRPSGGFRATWWRNFIRMEVELTRGVSEPARAEKKTWREQSYKKEQNKTKGFGLRVVTPE